MAKRRQLRGFDLKQLFGFGSLIGVDEAGRGALAGPVVAGAVLGVRQAVQAGQVLWLLLTHQLVNEAQAAQ